jgi:hypothetical protein
MAQKMMVVTLKATGNVLGVLTRRGDPEGKLDPAVYLPDGIALRDPANPGERLTIIPQENLGVEVVDFVEDALSRPLSYYIDQGAAKLATTAPTISQTPSVNPAQQWKVKFTNKKQIVWIAMKDVSTDAPPIIASVKAPDTNSAADVEVPMGLIPGVYNAVVMVTGMKLVFELSLSVP